MANANILDFPHSFLLWNSKPLNVNLLEIFPENFRPPEKWGRIFRKLRPIYTRKLHYRKDYRAMRLNYNKTEQSDNTLIVY